MFRFLRQLRLPVILLAVIILLIFLHYVGILRPVENILIVITTPIQERVYGMGIVINRFYTSFASNDQLIKENQKLQDTVNQLTVENSQLKTLFSDQQEIQVQQSFITSHGLQAITAHIIGKNPEPNLQSVILDKGSADGIVIDQPLMVSTGILVGKIYQVKPNSSEAILINDSRSRVAAIVQNASLSKGVVSGEHGLSLLMELIPRNEVMKEGDVVITSGIEPAIPRGLVIGQVSKVTSEPNAFFQTALIQSMVRLDNLTIVSVLKNQNL